MRCIILKDAAVVIIISLFLCVLAWFSNFNALHARLPRRGQFYGNGAGTEANGGTAAGSARAFANFASTRNLQLPRLPPSSATATRRIKSEGCDSAAAGPVAAVAAKTLCIVGPRECFLV